MCISTPVEQSESLAISSAIKGCENLSNWINRLKAKEAILKSSRVRDLRREVLLLHAAQRAQEQLAHQQSLNRQRWNEIKARELERCSTCSAFKRFCSCMDMMEMEGLDDGEESRKIDHFFESLSNCSRKRPSILRNCGSKRPKLATG